MSIFMHGIVIFLDGMYISCLQVAFWFSALESRGAKEQVR